MPTIVVALRGLGFPGLGNLQMEQRPGDAQHRWQKRMTKVLREKRMDAYWMLQRATKTRGVRTWYREHLRERATSSIYIYARVPMRPAHDLDMLW